MNKMNKKGFTLIESMVVVAIVAIGAAIAIPNYQVWVQTQNLKDDMVNLKGALQIARITAMANGQTVEVTMFPKNDRQYQAAGTVSEFKNGIRLAPPYPTAIRFTSSGRRSFPTGAGPQDIILQSDNGERKMIRVSAIGDVR